MSSTTNQIGEDKARPSGGMCQWRASRQSIALGAVKRGARTGRFVVSKNRQANFGCGLSHCHDFSKIGGTGLGLCHSFDGGSGGGGGLKKHILQKAEIPLDKFRCRVISCTA